VKVKVPRGGTFLGRLDRGGRMMGNRLFHSCESLEDWLLSSSSSRPAEACGKREGGDDHFIDFFDAVSSRYRGEKGVGFWFRPQPAGERKKGGRKKGDLSRQEYGTKGREGEGKLLPVQLMFKSQMGRADDPQPPSILGRSQGGGRKRKEEKTFFCHSSRIFLVDGDLRGDGGRGKRVPSPVRTTTRKASSSDL